MNYVFYLSCGQNSCSQVHSKGMIGKHIVDDQTFLFLFISSRLVGHLRLEPSRGGPLASQALESSTREATSLLH